MNLTEENIEDCIKQREMLLNELDQYKDLVMFELQPVFPILEGQKFKIHEKLWKLDFFEYKAPNCSNK